MAAEPKAFNEAPRTPLGYLQLPTAIRTRRHDPQNPDVSEEGGTTGGTVPASPDINQPPRKAPSCPTRVGLWWLLDSDQMQLRGLLS